MSRLASGFVSLPVRVSPDVDGEFRPCVIPVHLEVLSLPERLWKLVFPTENQAVVHRATEVPKAVLNESEVGGGGAVRVSRSDREGEAIVRTSVRHEVHERATGGGVCQPFSLGGYVLSRNGVDERSLGQWCLRGLDVLQMLGLQNPVGKGVLHQCDAARRAVSQNPDSQKVGHVPKVFDLEDLAEVLLELTDGRGLGAHDEKVIHVGTDNQLLVVVNKHRVV